MTKYPYGKIVWNLLEIQPGGDFKIIHSLKIKNIKNGLIGTGHEQPKKFNLKTFSLNESDIENEMKRKRVIDRREIRMWENKEPITATLWILGEYIISI